MNLLFDEAGKFLAGRILSEAEASAQVELDSGKRVKVKAANQLLRFDKPAPADLLAQARREGRIGKVAADPLLPLRAFIDIGGAGASADAFTIWIVQWVGNELRADFQHLRRWRKSVEQAQSYTFKAVITVIATGLLGAIWLGIKVMLGR